MEQSRRVPLSPRLLRADARSPARTVGARPGRGGARHLGAALRRRDETLGSGRGTDREARVPCGVRAPAPGGPALVRRRAVARRLLSPSARALTAPCGGGGGAPNGRAAGWGRGGESGG